MGKKNPFFYHGIFLQFLRRKYCVKTAEKAAQQTTIIVLYTRYF